MPTQIDGVMVGKGIAPTTSAMVPIAAFGGQKSGDGMKGCTNISNGPREGTWGMIKQFKGRESSGGGMFDGMALPDNFLRLYYIQVRI